MQPAAGQDEARQARPRLCPACPRAELTECRRGSYVTRRVSLFLAGVSHSRTVPDKSSWHWYGLLGVDESPPPLSCMKDDRRAAGAKQAEEARPRYIETP